MQIQIENLKLKTAPQAITNTKIEKLSSDKYKYKYQIEMRSSGKSLLERNEELAARNRAVAEQCHQKLEVRVVICCDWVGAFLLFDCATKQLGVVVYDHKTAEFSGVKKSVDKRSIFFGNLEFSSVGH